MGKIAYMGVKVDWGTLLIAEKGDRGTLYMEEKGD